MYDQVGDISTEIGIMKRNETYSGAESYNS